MKNLLIAFLLAVFSLQASVVAAGDHATAVTKVEHRQAAAANDLLEHIDVDADWLKVSPAVEELSDYLPAVLSISPTSFSIPPSRQIVLAFLSIDLPTIRPPPRG